MTVLLTITKISIGCGIPFGPHVQTQLRLQIMFTCDLSLSIAFAIKRFYNMIERKCVIGIWEIMCNQNIATDM